MARVFHRGTGQNALDRGLTVNEDALRRKAYAISHGEKGPHAAEPNHPTRVEQHYLDAIQLFRARRMSAGFDAIEKGDFQVLLRLGREKQKRQRRGLEDRPLNDGRPWWVNKPMRDPQRREGYSRSRAELIAIAEGAALADFQGIRGVPSEARMARARTKAFRAITAAERGAGTSNHPVAAYSHGVYALAHEGMERAFAAFSTRKPSRRSRY